MKILNRISFLVVMLVLTASFSQCSSAQKLQERAPTQFGDVYCQSWTAGVQGGGSGINIFIPTLDNTVVFDSVYFRGKATKLEVKPNNKQLYIGRFITDTNQPKDIILSSDSSEEYENQMPKKQQTIPFDLKDDECIVSYIKDEQILYYKITNIEQKEPINYPSAPPNQN